MIRDAKNETTQVELVPAVNSGNQFETAGSDATNEETGIDLAGKGRRVLLVISVGATSTATLQVDIKSGTDNSTFGTSEYSAIFDTTGKTVVDLVPSKRYIRAEWTVSTTGALASHAYVDFAVVGIVYNERVKPSGVA